MQFCSENRKLLQSIDEVLLGVVRVGAGRCDGELLGNGVQQVFGASARRDIDAVDLEIFFECFLRTFGGQTNSGAGVSLRAEGDVLVGRGAIAKNPAALFFCSALPALSSSTHLLICQQQQCAARAWLSMQLLAPSTGNSWARFARIFSPSNPSPHDSCTTAPQVKYNYYSQLCIEFISHARFFSSLTAGVSGDALKLELFLPEARSTYTSLKTASIMPETMT